MMTGKPTPPNVDKHILDVLKAASIPLDTQEIQRRLKGTFNSRKIASAVGRLAVQMLINRVGEVLTSKGRYGLYEIVQTRGAKPVPVWTPPKPMQPTVIPIRERGRIAPDVSDGVYIAMVSKAGYYARIDA